MTARIAKAATRRVRALVSMLGAIGLSGCSVLSPMPTWELVKATGAATSYALSQAPGKASETVHHGDAPVTHVCIEYSRNTPLADLVPALQAELRAQGVSSRVYEAGATLDECPVWLRYAASIDWDIPPLGAGYRAYLSTASVSLQRANGTLMASSSYDVETTFGISKWATTRRKLASVVRAVVTGFES